MRTVPDTDQALEPESRADTDAYKQMPPNDVERELVELLLRLGWLGISNLQKQTARLIECRQH